MSIYSPFVLLSALQGCQAPEPEEVIVGHINDGATDTTTTDPGTTEPEESYPCEMSKPQYTDSGNGYIGSIDIEGDCSLQDAKDEIDDTKKSISSYVINLFGGSGNFIGDLSIGAGDVLTINAQGDAISNIIPEDRTDGTTSLIHVRSGAYLYVNGSRDQATGVSNLSFSGFGENIGISGQTGTTVHVTDTDFNYLANGIAMSGGNLSSINDRHELTTDAAISLTDGADAYISSLGISKGIVGNQSRTALIADGAGSVELHGAFIRDQVTTESTIKLDADYLEVLGLSAVGNMSEKYILEWNSGCDFPSPAQNWSFYSASLIADNLHGDNGALTMGSECEIVANNIGVINNEGLFGNPVTAVDLSDPNNPDSGRTTFTQSIVYGNDVLDSPILRSFDDQQNPTAYEVVEYNSVLNNGMGDILFSDYEGNNITTIDPAFGAIMYDAIRDEYNPFHYYAQSPDLINAGNPNAQYPDWNATGPQPGSVNAFLGPQGDFLVEAIENECIHLEETAECDFQTFVDSL